MKRKVEFIQIVGEGGVYEVIVHFQGKHKSKTFTLWYEEEEPYICPRECEEILLCDMVIGGKFYDDIMGTIAKGGYVWARSNYLEGQEF